MDAAFLELLGKKDFSYITVKECCETARVNRSTFCLHYETIGDLLAESVDYMNDQFLAHMNRDSSAFSAKLRECPLDELYLNLIPYLTDVKTHRRLFRTAAEKADVLGLSKSYDRMFRHIFTPILEHYGVPEHDRTYLMVFYIHGLMDIVAEWLKADCADSIEDMAAMMQKCVMQYGKQP